MNSLPISPDLLAAAQELLAAQAALAGITATLAKASDAYQAAQAAEPGLFAAGSPVIAQRLQELRSADNKRRAGLAKVTRAERKLEILARRAVLADRQTREPDLAGLNLDTIPHFIDRELARPACRLSTAALEAAKA